MESQETKTGTEVKIADLKVRTKLFAVRIIRLVNKLPLNRACDVIGKQLLRSATSVGANYRAACRGRSTAEFCAKLGIVEEEADESAYWLELLAEAGIFRKELLEDLHEEAGEIVAMVVASIRTAPPEAITVQGSEFRIPNSAFRIGADRADL